MTIFQLQEDLAEEIEKTLSDMLFKNPAGNMVKIRTYRQDVPKRRHKIKTESKTGAIMPQEEDICEGKDPYPFCVVRAESGEMLSGGQRISIMLIFAIFNDDTRNQGQQELLNIFQRLAERFIKDPVLQGKYSLAQEEGISWILDDEDKFPYFIGGMSMQWDTFFVEREDDYV